MTPFELDILLWYYGHARDHDVVINDPPIWAPTRDMFIGENLIENDPVPTEIKTRTYRLTERGNAYIEFILRVPLPVHKWEVLLCEKPT